MNTAIRAEGLGKQYQLGERPTGETIRERLSRAMTRPWRKLNRVPRETFWALDDVSFEIEEGAVVGIVGRNGSGKSTLLKILSRVAEPTTGAVELNGRVASLLEVGTGFHPELSGRENIFLNGAILGMSRAEIRQKFDDIVEFAEVASFIDTPVKHYSSGMYMRLAFAVAAHLEPETLVVDEVLAVGDAQFQKKCLGKMGDVAREGRTVLFVSHNLGAVATLCQSVIHLKDGRLMRHGPTREVLADYAAQTDLLTGECDLTLPSVRRRGNRAAQFTAARLVDSTGQPCATAVQGEPFQIELTVEARERVNLKVLGITLVDRYGNDLLTTMHYDSLDLDELFPGRYSFACSFDPNVLAQGNFNVRLALFGPNYLEYDHIPHAFSIVVSPPADSPDLIEARSGTVSVPLVWKGHRIR